MIKGADSVETAYDVVIVGAGYGGVATAAALVRAGYHGSVGILSDELVLPYERPPLSKSYFIGKDSLDCIRQRDATYWEAAVADLVLGARVVSIDPDGKAVHLHEGRSVGYGALVWAAGGTARTLSGLEGWAAVHTLRSLTDADRIIDAAGGAPRALVIGGGYLGLEVAAALSTRGASVTLAEIADQLLARVAGPTVSAFFGDLHRRNGVEILLGASVDAVGADAAGHATSAVVGGTARPFDLVLCAIGMEPVVAPLVQAGAVVGDGVEVDESCRTSLPHVYAVGDCVSQAHPYYPPGGSESNRCRTPSIRAQLLPPR